MKTGKERGREEGQRQINRKSCGSGANVSRKKLSGCLEQFVSYSNFLCWDHFSVTEVKCLATEKVEMFIFAP